MRAILSGRESGVVGLELVTGGISVQPYYMLFKQFLEAFSKITTGGRITALAYRLGETAVHTFRAKTAVELDRRTLRDERGQIIPLAGLVRNALAPGTEIDDSLRTSEPDRKSTRLNSSHQKISYAVFCLKKKKNK